MKIGIEHFIKAIQFVSCTYVYLGIQFFIRLVGFSIRSTPNGSIEERMSAQGLAKNRRGHWAKSTTRSGPNSAERWGGLLSASSVPDKIGGGGKSASHSYLFTPLNCFAGNAASQSF
ncbi:hypothetical protein [Shewanella chilikensis]|uniref:hypothetical protein n=1 Tax=Shewanella chilikensis TaxID=558541 RepID=UPI0011B75BE8|nr:hypothetical protein [Shewanella chilikensis]MCL1152530.1 hypothetical protein [Shewanella chilikensis]